jgi:hypothetical protein
MLLANMNAAEQAAHIETMDAMVRRVGDKISHPGFWPQLLLRMIGISKYGDVARTIRLIDTTVVERRPLLTINSFNSPVDTVPG